VSAILERADELFGASADIVVYEAVPDGEERKDSLAAPGVGSQAPSQAACCLARGGRPYA
jgi:hypothetical protein